MALAVGTGDADIRVGKRRNGSNHKSVWAKMAVLLVHMSAVTSRLQQTDHNNRAC
jgi:hypothetical protein